MRLFLLKTVCIYEREKKNMDKDLDMKLYNSFLNGNTKAFDELYLKYKDKIKYFIFNIIKNYEKSEDIMQETFMYVLRNKVKQGYSFKYYIYLIAKSRAINYLNSEKRRTEITNMYLSKDEEKILCIIFVNVILMLNIKINITSV